MSSATSLFLNVSELHITNKNKDIKTVLGSCIAVVIFVPRLKLSAICHARLPHGTKKSSAKGGFCYVDESMHFMLDTVLKKGAKKSELVIKAFGGANVIFNEHKKKKLSQTIGQQNISMVENILKEQGLALTSCDFGGQSGRKLIYNTHTNEVLIKVLKEEPATENHIKNLLENFIFNR